MRRRFEIDGQQHDAALLRRGDGYALRFDGEDRAVGLSAPAADGSRTLRVGSRSWNVHVVHEGNRAHVQIGADSFAVRIVEPLDIHSKATSAASDRVARAPMPGTVVAVATQAGARVKRGETLMVIESMKLETAITAWRDGTVEAVHLAPGQTFDRDAPLVSLTPEAEG
jgi:biotin carboxyl carrier protein